MSALVPRKYHERAAIARYRDDMAADFMKRLKPLLDAGVDLVQMSPSRAEAVVRELVRQGEVRRHEADALLTLLVQRGKGATGQMVDALRSEAGRQVERLIERVASLEQRVEALTTLLGRSAGRSAGGSSPMTEPSAASPKKTVAKKAASKKPPAKKTPAKKAVSSKKPPAKKAPAKKASTQQASASNAVSKRARPRGASAR